MARKGAGKTTRKTSRRGGSARGRAGKSKRKRSPGRSHGIGQRFKRWITRQLIRLTLLSALVGGLVAAWLYQDALEQVDGVLARPIWEEQGRITGDVLARAGLQVGPEEMASVLQNAGYSRVASPLVEGDFSVHRRRIFVKDGGDDVLLTFSGDKIESVSPSQVHRFNASELAGLGAATERRTPITRGQMPEHLVLAVLAMEDARFFEHPGIDGWGIARALVVNLVGDGLRQGGSTLTQQLAKNLFLTPERSMKRKVKELALAVALETRLSKDEILELYLNQVYLGAVGGMGICGVDQAAKTYFGTSAKRLSLGQAATLAGIISAPNRYSPSRHPDRATERRNIALKRMVDLGWLAPGERSAWLGRGLQMAKHSGYRIAPWAIDEAIEAVEERLGDGVVSDGTVTIQTTIDALLQRVAEKAVKNGIRDIEKQYASARGAQAAVVAIDPHTGDVLALVGGRAYAQSTFNRATRAERQVGSTVKPLSWLALLEADPEQNPNSWVPDDAIEREVNGEVWSPENYDGEYLGEVTLEYALAQSRNIPAVHVSEWVGLEALSQHLQRLGMRDVKPYPATALGAFDASPLELARAYSVFPGQGEIPSVRIVQSVRLPNGAEGWTEQTSKVRVASHRASFLVSTMMQETMDTGTGKRAQSMGVVGVVGGKTGTTDRARDAWFVGFTPHLVVAVWVGHDKSRDLGLTGAQAALPIWASIVAGSGRMSDEAQAIPEGVVVTPLCAETGEVAVEGCSTTEDSWSSIGVEQGTLCTLHSDTQHSETHSIIERIRQRLSGQPEIDAAEPTEATPERKKRRGFWRRRRGKNQ